MGDGSLVDFAVNCLLFPAASAGASQMHDTRQQAPKRVTCLTHLLQSEKSELLALRDLRRQERAWALHFRLPKPHHDGDNAIEQFATETKRGLKARSKWFRRNGSPSPGARAASCSERV